MKTNKIKIKALLALKDYIHRFTQEEIKYILNETISIDTSIENYNLLTFKNNHSIWFGDSVTVWYDDQKLAHRNDDLPAIVRYNNNKIFCQEWWKHGNHHRDNNKFAVITCSGFKQIFIEGKLIKQGYDL